MNVIPVNFRAKKIKPETAAMAAALIAAAFFWTGRAVAIPANELHTAAAVRALTSDEASHAVPVKLRGVVTFFNGDLFSRFIQDDTAGIYLRDPTNMAPLVPGQFVEVEGETSPGEYAPTIFPKQVRVLGLTNLPVAQLVTFEQLATGKEDSQFVEIAGIVRSLHFDEASKYYLIDVATGGGRLTVYAPNLPVTGNEDLVDSTVRVRGVCSTQFNRQGQLFAIRLMVPRPEDLVVEIHAPGDPFDIPTQAIGSLLQFAPQGTYGHRVKISGTVVYQQRGSALYIQDENYGLFVQTKENQPVQVGDHVEVIGFVAQGQYTPVLQDSLYRKIRSGPEPQPAEINYDEALKGTHDSRLVRIQAKLLDRAQHSREQFLVLESGDFIFHAYYNQNGGEDAFAEIENGSKVAVTGICLVEPGDWQAGVNWRAKSFHLLLRSPADVVVLQAPPWWTLRKLLWIASALSVVVLAAFTWVVVLRRRVQKQTGIIRQQLHVEAALKERYVDLFENANDMVFTHDLSGRITSINKAGEQFLQRRREEILSGSLVELVAEDQRSVAQNWLDQIVKGVELPTAEWDFLNASGQRVKLEISTRLIEEGGKILEVESIARDITERKRLEREILEISNREQRRIGHDLHDGVCQQLAGIAYLIDILADRLQEKGTPESAEAERIGGLINEAITQTRGVARGLFPVRLEENGLVSALEELAAHVSNLFKIKCLFFCDDAPPMMDNGASLHLYYIMQEAVLNAAKHGKASSITITAARSATRYSLTVRDDGEGFLLTGGSQTGMGIRIMRYRARVIGATLDVKTEVGSGTQVNCTFSPGRPGDSKNN